jgi:hypothetical protein
MNQLNQRFFQLCYLIIFWAVGTSIAIAQPASIEPKNSAAEVIPGDTRLTLTPLAEQLFSQPTAKQLHRGEVLINLDTRLYFLPDLVQGAVDDSDSAVNFNTGFSWGITDELQLTLQFQHVDSSSPVKQGDFTSERTEDNEASVEIKQRLWEDAEETKFLSGVFAASWGTRGFKFTQAGQETEINNRDVFVSLAVPFTTQIGDRWQFNLAPTIAFFKEDSAAFFHRLPDDDESSFGTTLGVSGGVAYQLNRRMLIFTDVFIPLTGNNSINRDSGQPDRAIAYNAGIRYLTSPRLALDIYASNTFASFAPLSLTADRDFMALGTKIVFMPDAIDGKRNYSDRFDQNKTDLTPLTNDGLAFFDGGTLPSEKFLFQMQGGSQGILTALRYGFLSDFEGGIYLDYVSGELDESEQGISGKIRFLNQAENDPFTLSVAATAGLTNEPFINFRQNDSNAFESRDLEKTVPIFTPGGDDGENGKLIILTLALPVNYEIAHGTAIWITPILGYVQREGLKSAGANLGGSISISKEFSLLGEVGANLAGNGNSFDGEQLEDKIPWTMAIRWTPLSLLGKKASATNSNAQLELYLTNRVGSSTWHQLRVRENNEIGVGLGLLLPLF